MAGFADEFIRLCSDREGGLQNITVAGNEKLTGTGLPDFPIMLLTGQ
jgi:hypothetical protein